MCFYLGAILLFLILLLFALLFLLFRRHAIRKVNMMSETEKETLLSSLTRPAGFSYLPDQDIFVTMADSWQRELGYCHFYDTAAPLGNMIFECEPVYFDYEDHTWLIEFWKGQYGINTGAEIGIYRADTLLSPRDYQKTLFHAVSDEEMPYFEQTLFRNKTSLFQQYDKTWWLAGFRMGLFSDPKHLSTDVSVTFHSVDMRNAFLDALEQLGYQAESGPWRSAYLMGAWELREGNQAEKEGTNPGRESTIRSMTVDMILTYIDIMTDALAAQNDDLSLKLNIADTGETFRVIRRDGVLMVYKGETDLETDCTITCARLQLLALMNGNMDVTANMKIDGDDTVPARLVKYMTPINRNFNIIEP